MTFQSNVAGNTELTPEEKAAAAAMSAEVVKRIKAGSGNIPKDVQLVEKQRGEALAELAINEARHQSSAWGRIYVSMLALVSEGRAGFRSAIAAHQKAMQAHVKANNIDDMENPVYATAKRSAMSRLSELTTITKALDAGVHFDPSWPFHYAVGQARTALKAAGAGSSRGRKPTPLLDKIKAFLEKNVPEGEWESVRDLVTTMAALHE